VRGVGGLAERDLGKKSSFTSSVINETWHIY
jgi:hypothetical protein